MALTTLSARTSKRLAALRVAHADAARAAAVLEQLGDLEPVGAHRAEALGLGEHGQHEAAVVGLAVVEQVAGRRRAAGQRGQQLDDLVAGDHAVALGLQSLDRRLAPAAPAAAQPSTAITSYMFRPTPDQAVGPRAVEGGHDEAAAAGRGAARARP